MARILVVDDEQDLCEILQFNFQNLGYEVTTASSAEEALALPDLAQYDLAVLDVMLEGISGFQMARQMKQTPALAHIPIIFCTARDAENDTLTGFNIGADDYISKPFRLSEVTARVKAVLRRSHPRPNDPESAGTVETDAPTAQFYHNPVRPSQNQEICCGELRIDLADKRAYLGAEDLLLTRKEYEILVLLASRQGHLFTRQDILQNVWPDDVFVLDRSVDVSIARLRKKLGPVCGKFIISRSGYGYAFQS